MKVCAGMVLSLVLALPLVAAPAGYVVKDGAPVARICVPANAGQPITIAVEELRSYIKKISGAELFVDKGAGAPVTEGRISLEVRQGAFRPADGSDQGFTIEEKDNEVRILGNSELGVLFGVYQYLGELGVRWYEPGEIGENVPQQKTIAIGQRKKDYAPAFITRSMESWAIPVDWVNDKGEVGQPGLFANKEDAQDYIVWRLRNRLQFCRSIGKSAPYNFDQEVAYCDEGLRNMALKGADFNKEPERWPLVTREGRQVRAQKAAQICFTNEKNVATATESCLEYLRQNPGRGVAPMALIDCAGICECPNCKKVGGEPPYDKERLVLTFMNKVARGVAEKMPGHGITLHFPYYELQMPPPGFKMEPNILSMCCRQDTWDAADENKPYLPFTKGYYEKITAVGRAGSALGFYDYILEGAPQPLSLLDVLPGYRKLGFKHCTSEVMNRSEQLCPLFWVVAKYVWDGEGNPREMLKTFCAEYYGAKAGPDIYEIQEAVDQNSRRAEHIIYGGLNDGSMMMTESLIQEGSAILSRDALEASGREKVRLERFRDTFEMFGRMARIYRAYGRALNERTPEQVKAFEKGCADFKQFWKDRNMARTCDSANLAVVLKMSKTKIPLQAAPAGRKELADKNVWMEELFAGEPVPANVPDLFPLPEVFKFRVDYEDKGLQEGWQTPDYDDSKGWQPISTWDCYENQGYSEVDGRFWYRVAFTAPQFPAGKRIMMRVGSIDDNGEFYVNGQLAAPPKSGDMWDKSYAFDVTPFIKPGQRNVIAVRGYDATGAGGIWRPCALYTK
jgi:hypothetical protein